MEPAKKTTFLVAGEEVETLAIATPLWRILKRDGRRKGLTIIKRVVIEEDVTPEEPKPEFGDPNDQNAGGSIS